MVMAMKMEVSATAVIALAGVAALGLAGVWLYRSVPKIKAAAAKAVDLVNPVSPNNVAAQGSNIVAQAITGRDDETFGGMLAEWFSPTVRAANAMVNSPSMPTTAPQETTYGLNAAGTWGENAL